MSHQLNDLYTKEDFPQLTAYGEEPWRIIRLARVVGYLFAINSVLLDKVTRLHDSKGTLTVFWNFPPLEKEKALMVRAWRSGIGDYSDSVEHIVHHPEINPLDVPF